MRVTRACRVTAKGAQSNRNCFVLLLNKIKKIKMKEKM